MKMEVGNEISGKIRSAIKAKLVELGAYLDDELPDYIMVMVANKKSQHQMASDLGLFLNENTEKFTTWLHGLLQKLQSITSESTVSFSSREKPVDKSKSREQPSSNEGQSKHRKHSEKQTVDDPKSKKREDVSEDRKERKRRKSDQEKKSKASDHDSKVKEVTEKSFAVTEDIAAPVVQETPSTSSVIESERDAAVNSSTHDENEKLTTEPVLLLDIEKPEVPSVNQSIKNASAIDFSDFQVDEEDDLSSLLLTENDELTKELEQETAVILPNKKSESSKTPVNVIRVSDDEVSAEPKRGAASIIISSDSSKDGSPLRSSRRKAVTPPMRQSGRHTGLVRAVEPRPSEILSRKRQGPVSVVGSVSKLNESDDEEGYDPRNPAVGNVASVVKVTARKSSVPVKMQANKSLLLKAMTEAEKSVETQRRVAITPIRPFLRSEGRGREQERSRDHERSSRSSSSSARESRRHSPTGRLAQASLRQAISQPRSSRRSDPPVYIPTRKVQPAPRVDRVDSDRVGIVSKSRRQEAEERAWLDTESEMAPPRKCIKREKEAPIVNFVIETEYDTKTSNSQPEPSLVKVKQEPASPRQSSPPPEPSITKQQKKRFDAGDIDSRVVEYEPEMVASPAEKPQSESGSQGVPVLLEDMDAEEFALDQDVLELTESSSGLFEEDVRHAMMKDKAKDKTRFVVTLDGVDTEQYEIAGEGEQAVEDMLVDEVQSVKMNQESFASGPHLIPQPRESIALQISPPKIQPLNISLKDSDEEGEAMETETTPLKKAKMMERCKFWPACVNGSACDYHHPTIHCKTFPLCKFGDKCLYIHPNCRFDSKCTRPDCPYTHSSRRPIIPAFQAPYIKPMYRPPPPPSPQTAPRSASSTQCKYFPSCSNISCPFFHPKPCRFGVLCKNKEKGCPFYHPALPTMDKLTWVAAKDAGVPAVGAVNEAKKT